MRGVSLIVIYTKQSQNLTCKDMVNFLQLSDIHHIYGDEEDGDDRQIHTALLDDLKRYSSGGLKISNVLICGDVANSCDGNQYELASSFIAEICDMVKCEPHEVYIVPGNHDKNRDCDHAVTRELIYNKLRGEDGNSYFNEIKDKEPQILKLLYSPLKSYYEFAVNYKCCDDVALNCIFQDNLNEIKITPKDKIYWKDTILKTENGFKLNIYGLSSVLTSGKNDKETPLFLPQRAYNIPKSEYDINLLMMHHPLTENSIIGYKNIEKKIDNKFQIQLYGHEHKQSSTFKSGIKIYSGALNPHGDYDGDYRPSYNIIGISITEESPVKCVVIVDIISHKWDGNYFCKDESESKKFEFIIDNSEKPLQVNRAGNNSMNIKSKINTKELQYKFMIRKDRAAIMERSTSYEYDQNSSEQINCIYFLKDIMSDSKKIETLWNMINK